MRDLILRGGENIYPMEVEHRLVEHPEIDDAAVIGVDHEILGQEVKAFVIRRDGSELTAAEVQRWVGEALAGFKVPAHVEFRTELPYTESGKVVKATLEAEERERAAAKD
jgi:acyl-coenzyme A synthetase/AMP-(fatty) acid ligase